MKSIPLRLASCFILLTAIHSNKYIYFANVILKKGKAVPLQAWSGGSRKLRIPDFMTTAQDGGEVVSLRHRPLFTPQEILLVLISVTG